MVRRGFTIKVTLEQRCETGEVMNPTYIYMKTVPPGSIFKAFEVKCAYHEQFEEGWYGWNRVKEKKENQKSNKVGKGEDSEGPCRPSRGFWPLLQVICEITGILSREVCHDLTSTFK